MRTPPTLARCVREIEMAGASKKNASPSTSRSTDILNRVQRAWGESPFYQAQLKGPAPDRVLSQPLDPFTADKDLARAFARGRISFSEESIDCEGEIERIWDIAQPEGAVFAFLQEFSWLRHLAVLEDAGQEVARQLVRSWLKQNEKWSPEAWAPYFTSERLVNLCAHHPLVLAKSDATWRSRILTSMARQTRHLARTAHRSETGFDRLMTSLGLTIAGFCLPGCEGPAERGLEMARRELRLQLRPDGAHVSRNPSRQLKLAVRLQSVLNAIEARGFQPPGFLRHTVVRTSAMATFFRCADGKLAIFNGGYEDDGNAITSLQTMLDPENAPSDFARHSGYHKLTAGRATVILDVGVESVGALFRSAGSFHFSSGRSRILTNCGNGAHRAREWGNALSQRDAHSSLSFQDNRILHEQSSHRRAEDSKGQLIEYDRELSAPHEGLSGKYSRRMFLAAGGGNLRGEELIEGLNAEMIATAVWRFHLHPSVRASLARDRRSVILLLPNKEGWRFKSNCPDLRLEKTVYCGEGGAPIAAEQIVLPASGFGALKGARLSARWAFARSDIV